MSPDAFRTLALSLPGTTEASHVKHPDFRVRGKIFASLGWPSDRWAMVKLTPQQQALFVRAAPTMFRPVKGGWGARGATNVQLATARKRAVRNALMAAWQNVAPKTLRLS